MQEQVLNRILQKPVVDAVIPGSTPVISFGDFTKARVATLGINPSSVEFLSGKSLIQDKKRLCDYETLGIPFNATLDKKHALKILDGSNHYFQNNPYRWFDGFDEILSATNSSYFDGSACHLDLVQSATMPAWRGLTAGERKLMLEQDREFFSWQVSSPNLKVVLLAGGLVKERVEKTFSFKTSVVDVISYMSGSKKTSVKLYEATWSPGQKFVGWTVNLQQMRASASEKQRINGLIAQFVRDQVS